MEFQYLTGVKPTGQFHIGNYLSTIKPILDNQIEDDTLVLIADLHAITSKNFKDIKKYKKEIYCIFNAFEIYNVIFQSDIQNMGDLYWILSCFTAKGLLNRSHSYKASIEENINKDKDPDKGIFMGDFTYPILMAADLSIFNTEYVFIGNDQMQHMNIANDIINKFNHVMKNNVLKIPEPILPSLENDVNILGFDGRKMSKSYNNTIPLMCPSNTLRKKLNSVKTNSKILGEPKQYDESPLTTIFDCFASDSQKLILRQNMIEGCSWKWVKDYVFECIDNYLEPFRMEYQEYMVDLVYQYGDFYDEIEERIQYIKEMVT